MSYTLNTPMASGKYKAHKIVDLPIDYLKNISISWPDPELKQFIIEKLESIKQLQESGKAGIKEPCGKVIFIDEESAMKRCRQIQTKYKEGFRMPYRAYYCDGCGGWHLSSN